MAKFDEEKSKFTQDVAKYYLKMQAPSTVTPRVTRDRPVKPDPEGGCQTTQHWRGLIEEVCAGGKGVITGPHLPPANTHWPVALTEAEDRALNGMKVQKDTLG